MAFVIASGSTHSHRSEELQVQVALVTSLATKAQPESLSPDLLAGCGWIKQTTRVPTVQRRSGVR
jgi:hypothetical protein